MGKRNQKWDYRIFFLQKKRSVGKNSQLFFNQMSNKCQNMKSFALFSATSLYLIFIWFRTRSRYCNLIRLNTFMFQKRFYTLWCIFLPRFWRFCSAFCNIILASCIVWILSSIYIFFHYVFVFSFLLLICRFDMKGSGGVA